MKQSGLLLTIIATLFISACGGGGSSSTPTNNNTGGNAAAKGIVYPVVAGLSYKTDSASGVVAADGSYSYKESESVTFSTGGIELATVPAAPKVTPLPLDDDVASGNMLRLFKALDTDADLSNGVSLPQVATPPATTVDMTNEASVTTALASLAPTATLPPAGDAQVAATLAATKATALQNMGTYGATYRAIIFSQTAGSSSPGYPADAVATLTSQPNWTADAVTGTVTFTLEDHSTKTVTLNNTKGSYTASGSTFNYTLLPVYSAKSRVFKIYVRQPQQTGKAVMLTLRDNSQPNRPPIPKATETFGFTSPTSPWTYTFTSVPGGPGDVTLGSTDSDGIVVTQSWVSSKGKKGTGNLFSEQFYYGEKGSITLTVTDDEGASATKTFEINSNAGFTSAMLGGKTVATTVDGEPGMTYNLNANGTWSENNASSDRQSGTWHVDGSGRFVAENKSSTGATLDTLTVTITSGSLPSFNVIYRDAYPDGSADTGVGTVTIK